MSILEYATTELRAKCNYCGNVDLLSMHYRLVCTSQDVIPQIIYKIKCTNCGRLNLYSKLYNKYEEAIIEAFTSKGYVCDVEQYSRQFTAEFDYDTCKKTKYYLPEGWEMRYYKDNDCFRIYTVTNLEIIPSMYTELLEWVNTVLKSRVV